MFRNTSSTNNSILANDEGVGGKTNRGSDVEEQEENESGVTYQAGANDLPGTAGQIDQNAQDNDADAEDPEEFIAEDEEFQYDIESQIKTSIIDATKVKPQTSPNAQLDDELADFAEAPHELNGVGDDEEDEDDEGAADGDGDDDDEEVEVDEQYLELDNFPNNEIIVLADTDLNSSLASDNVSEDPLAIDDFTQPLVRDSDNVLDSSSVTTNEEVDTSGDLTWLKLPPDGDEQETSTSLQATAHHSHGPELSVTPTHVKTKEDELRSDGGSDSGLGSETSTLQMTLTSRSDSAKAAPTHEGVPTGTSLGTIPNSSDATDLPVASTSQASSDPKRPLRSNLKRRLEDADGMDLVPDMSTTSAASTTKRQKRSINFDSVQVYYFPRQQGFGCVPTVGGCTLGMGARHIAFKTMTLAEHAAELRRAHRNQNPDMQPRGSSSDDTEESEEDYLSEGSGSDADGDSNGFLQPVTPKQRRALLKAAGVRKIDASEKIECRDIRNSREVCGCSCREFCDPETCACSQAGIKCQVDRAMFPCGCTREACGNTVGRVEFNPTRVRTHYIHTVMRLDMEQRQGQNPSNTLNYSSSGNSGVSAAVSHCYFMQTQSNYSSGYASPAYTPDGSVSYYQQQTPTSASAAQQQQEQQSSYSSHPDLHTPQYAIDSLDPNLFASGTNATPSYGELLAPTYHSLSYGGATSTNASQLSPYNAYHQHQTSSSASVSGSYSPSGVRAAGTALPPSTYSSCAVPSAPPFGIATTTASAIQYHHAIVLETTASMTSTTTFLAAAPTGTATCAFSGARQAAGGGNGSASEFISLSSPIASSSRLSQINDLLQHNRNTTAALVAVSESPGSSLGYAAGGRNAGSAVTDQRQHSGAGNTNTVMDSIDTPPIEDAQRSCMAFDELPPPMLNPTPIVAVLEPNAGKLPESATGMGAKSTAQMPLQQPPSTPQPRQPLDVSLNGGCATD
ncbi:uncharacterized protein LOC115631725 isoform X2 [Scaptodrosophila lebanonensis]|nr:uncharacterized protein LOC115631725 isoform X2 [Scaptodrosophila lebanonensis]